LAVQQFVGRIWRGICFAHRSSGGHAASDFQGNLMPHVINDEFRKVLDRLECKTVLGQVIDSDSETENNRFDETYPLRFHLRQLSRYIWYELLKESKREQDVLHAVNVVKREFAEYFEYGKVEISCHRDASSEIVRGYWDVRQGMRKESDAELRSSPLGGWCINTDPTIGFEFVEDDWLQNKELWQVEQDWTWAHAYDFLALLTIDSALWQIQRGEPFKAAVTAARASEYHGTATAVRWAQMAEAAAVSTLGRRGSDVRHSSNRAAKDDAIQLYLSKTWTSQAQAARVIGAKVSKTERVVEKWLREYKRSNSSGTETR
jgi:hypothetical protein